MTAPCRPGPSLSRLHDHSDTPHSADSSGRVISPLQRLLPDNTQHLNKTDSYGPSGICTCNSSKQAVADPHLRQHDHWDRQFVTVAYCFIMWTACILKRSHGICCRLYFKMTIYNIFMCKITVTNQNILPPPLPHQYSPTVSANWYCAQTYFVHLACRLRTVAVMRNACCLIQRSA